MTTTRKLAVGGLIVAAAGIVVQMIGGADYPAIPPGVLILLAAAALLAIDIRWTPLPGALIAIFISVGAVVTPNTGDHLSDPSDAEVFTGTLIQLTGLAAGVIFGLIVTAHSLRKRQNA